MKKETPRFHYKLTVAVMEGLTFEQAAEKFNLNSKVHALKIFRKTLTSVNYFLRSDMDEIIKKDFDIRYIRKRWCETQIQNL